MRIGTGTNIGNTCAYFTQFRGSDLRILQEYCRSSQNKLISTKQILYVKKFDFSFFINVISTSSWSKLLLTWPKKHSVTTKLEEFVQKGLEGLSFQIKSKTLSLPFSFYLKPLFKYCIIISSCVLNLWKHADIIIEQSPTCMCGEMKICQLKTWLSKIPIYWRRNEWLFLVQSKYFVFTFVKRLPRITLIRGWGLQRQTKHQCALGCPEI